jgi:hypothetical protein
MSPTIVRDGPYRFYFFSREETRMHVHVHSPGGEAKFWMEPRIELAHNYGMSLRQINIVHRLVEHHANEIRKAWKKHFGR